MGIAGQKRESTDKGSKRERREPTLQSHSSSAGRRQRRPAQAGQDAKAPARVFARFRWRAEEEWEATAERERAEEREGGEEEVRKGSRQR